MRWFLVLVIVLAAVPASAVAQARVCTVTGPEARGEAALRDEIRARGHYGFRNDRAYVARLIAAGPPSRAYGIHVTPAEGRYLDRREKLGVGAKLAAFLRRRPAIMDFWDVRDDWPRGPYMAVFVADDPAKYRAAVKRLASYPNATRVVRVRYSERAKDRIQRRIEHDRDALKRAGFELVETDADWGSDRVDVTLVTRRTDHARYFARRYGSVVRTHASAKSTSPACAKASQYEIAPDGLSLTVSWQEVSPKPLRVEVTERADRVAIGVVYAQSVYPGYGDAGGSTVVRLRAPLSGRPVYDAFDGARLIQAGPSPGSPACPVRPELSPLEQLMAERARYGMNTDRAVVQGLLDTDARFTPQEQAWVDSVQRLEVEDEVENYLQGGRVRKDWGGNTTVAHYPEPPYLIVRLLHNFAFRERQIRRIAKVPVHFVRSTVQRDWFYTLPLYIQDDARADSGFLDDFYVVQAEGHEDTQTVDVYVITTRTDADQFFRSRYGTIVRVHVIGDRVECRAGYSAS